MQLMTVISKEHLTHLPHVNLFLQHNRFIIFETTFKVEPVATIGVLFITV